MPAFKGKVRIILCVASLAAGPAVAQTSERPASQPQLVPTPPSLPPPAGVSDIPAQEWNAEDWEVQKPQLNRLELSGYFRLRGDLINNGTLGVDPPGINVLRPPSGQNTQGGANIRGRITPTLNITEDIQLIATFDLLDNLVLGSTPRTLPSAGPRVNVLEIGQNSPNGGWNALRDAIQVRRLYAKVATPLGELRFGRMPNKWGMGIFANEGDCLDCDYGDDVDRIAFVAMLGSFYLVPMLDFMSEGPTTAERAAPAGQARDLDQLDDAVQYSLQVSRKDAPEDIKETIERGQAVFNYGLWNMFRTQARETPRYFVDPTALDGAGTFTLETRDAFVYLVDGWAKLQYKKFSFEVEGLFSYATFRLVSNGLDASKRSFARQWGAAIDSRFDILPELYVRLRAGVASGDPSPGFGVGPEAYNKRGQFARADHSIDNFQFHRDYRVDLLMFREIIGTVTGAWYVRPEVAYQFSSGIGGRFAPLWGQALYASSTPSGTSSLLGIELDFEVFYAPKKNKGFDANLAYGLFIPLAGFNNVNRPANEQDPSVAHRILGRVAVSF